MGNVPDWVWCLLGGEGLLALLALVIRSYLSGSNPIDRPGFNPGPTEVEAEWTRKFPESRFDV
jgi:hypothetical protein